MGSLFQTLSRVYDSALFWVVEPLELSTQYLVGLSHTQRFFFFFYVHQLEEIFIPCKLLFQCLYCCPLFSSLSLSTTFYFSPVWRFKFFIFYFFFCCVCHHLESFLAGLYSTANRNDNKIGKSRAFLIKFRTRVYIYSLIYKCISLGLSPSSGASRNGTDCSSLAP